VTFFRYIAIQVAAYCIDMGIFLILVYLGFLGPIPSNVLGKIFAGIFAFFIHRSFTFRLDKRKRNGKQMFRYLCLLGLNVPISSGVLGLVLLIITTPVYAKFLSDMFIVLFSFWVSRKWVFVPDYENNNPSSDEQVIP
jgi:putative flippase GtrA